MASSTTERAQTLAPRTDLIVDVLGKLIEELGATADANTIPETLLRAVVRYSPWSKICASVYDTENGSLVSRFQAGFSETVAEGWGHSLDTRGPTYAAITSQSIVCIPDVRLAGEYSFMIDRSISEGFGSSLYIPVKVSAHEVACVSIHQSEAHDFTAVEQSLAAAVAAFAAISFRNLIARDRAIAAERSALRELSVAHDLITTQYESLKQLSAAHSRFLQMQLQDGADLPSVCASLASLVDMPVALLDRFFEVVSFSHAGSEGSETELAGLIDVARSAAERGGLGGPAQVSTPEGVYALSYAMIGNEQVGILVAGPAPHGIDETQLHMLDLGGVYVALESLKQRMGLEADLRLQQDFVDALLARDGSQLELDQRAGLLGIRMATSNTIVRIRLSEAPVAPSRSDLSDLAGLLMRRLLASGVGAVVMPVGVADIMIVLDTDALSPNGEQDVAQRARHILDLGVTALYRGQANDSCITIGVGSRGVGVDALRASQSEALRIIDTLERTGRAGETSTIGEVGSYALLSALDRHDRSQFIQRYLEPLLAYDRTNNAGLVETLSTYFSVAGNVQQTAEAMFLHISSVRYRLRRAEEVMCVSLKSDEDRLCVQLALRLAGMTNAE